jgi:hypothetical protein
MLFSDSSKMPLNHANGKTPVCPICRGEVARIGRRLIDRLWSLFVPVHRYRCRRYSCHWVGNLPTTSGTPPAIEMTER